MGWDSSLDPTTAPYGVLMATEAADTKVECPHCGKVSKNKQALAAHIRYKHKRGKKGTRKYTKRVHAHTEENHDGSQAKAHISYIFGKVETIIEYYANSNGISKSALAKGVADLLRQ